MSSRRRTLLLLRLLWRRSWSLLEELVVVTIREWSRLVRAQKCSRAEAGRRRVGSEARPTIEVDVQVEAGSHSRREWCPSAASSLHPSYIHLNSQQPTMPGVYGGDDVSAIVFDAGSSLLRGGWAGEDSPRVVIPSSYGWVHDDGEPSSSSAAASAALAPAAATQPDGDATMADAEGQTTGAAADGDKATAAASEEMDSRVRGAKYLAKKTPADAKGKKRFFGDFGVGHYRKGLEVSPTVVDGVGEYDAASLRGMSITHTLYARPQSNPPPTSTTSWTTPTLPWAPPQPSTPSCSPTRRPPLARCVKTSPS